MEETQAIIYGVKTEDTIHYIGKKTNGVKVDGTINKSDVSYPYRNKKIRNIFMNNEKVKLVPLKTVSQDEWYNEKLKEVLNKHKDNHPLLNAKWMLEGKRGVWEGTQGYWIGKKRDAHTLKRLSESKYIKVVEYDKDGKFKKLWNSAKEIGLQIFKDYKVVNGSGCSRIYDILDAKLIRNRYKFNSYWFRLYELMDTFNDMPDIINIQAFIESEKQRRSEIRKKTVQTHMRRYNVEMYNCYNEIIKNFENSDEAAYELKISRSTVNKLCGGKIKNCAYILKYGRKTRQPVNQKYPEYKIRPIPMLKPVKIKNKEIVKTKTRYSVVQYDLEGNEINTFIDVKEASAKLGLPASKIRLLCVQLNHKAEKSGFPVLKYGKKIQTVTKINPEPSESNNEPNIDVDDMYNDLPI